MKLWHSLSPLRTFPSEKKARQLSAGRVTLPPRAPLAARARLGSLPQNPAAGTQPPRPLPSPRYRLRLLPGRAGGEPGGAGDHGPSEAPGTTGTCPCATGSGDGSKVLPLQRGHTRTLRGTRSSRGRGAAGTLPALQETGPARAAVEQAAAMGQGADSPRPRFPRLVAPQHPQTPAPRLHV